MSPILTLEFNECPNILVTMTYSTRSNGHPSLMDLNNAIFSYLQQLIERQVEAFAKTFLAQVRKDGPNPRVLSVAKMKGHSTWLYDFSRSILINKVSNLKVQIHSIRFQTTITLSRMYLFLIKPVCSGRIILGSRCFSCLGQSFGQDFI